MLHSWMGITSNYSLMNEGETYTTEQIRHAEASLTLLTMRFGENLSVYRSQTSMAQYVKDQLACKIKCCR